MIITFLAGAELCADLADEPWFRTATEAEVILFLERHRMNRKEMAALSVDDNGRPYWLKTLTEDAPESVREVYKDKIRSNWRPLTMITITDDELGSFSGDTEKEARQKLRKAQREAAAQRAASEASRRMAQLHACENAYWVLSCLAAGDPVP